jgi:hypothetical protein
MAASHHSAATEFSYGVNLVNKDYAGRILLGLVKEVSMNSEPDML